MAVLRYSILTRQCNVTVVAYWPLVRWGGYGASGAVYGIKTIFYEHLFPITLLLCRKWSLPAPGSDNFLHRRRVLQKRCSWKSSSSCDRTAEFSSMWNVYIFFYATNGWELRWNGCDTKDVFLYYVGKDLHIERRNGMDRTILIWNETNKSYNNKPVRFPIHKKCVFIAKVLLAKVWRFELADEMSRWKAPFFNQCFKYGHGKVIMYIATFCVLNDNS